MSLHYAPRGLVGLLTPQANTTVEPEFSILMPQGYTHIAARMCSNASTLDARLVAYLDNAAQTAAQFANAPITSLALACTGSSYLVGRDGEQRLLAALAERHEVPAFTSASAIVDCLVHMNARRIVLASPYPESLTQASVAYWVSHGLTVVQVAPIATDSTQFHPIYGTSAAAAGRALDGLLGQRGIDAVLMLGTGLPTLAPLMNANRTQNSTPVLSSMLCLAWKAIELAEPGVYPISGWLAGTHWSHRLAPV